MTLIPKVGTQTKLSVDRSSVASLGLMGLLLSVLVADWSGAWSRPLRPVGKIESITGTVRRLPHSELSWDYVFRSAELETHDAILTSEQSSAVIKVPGTDHEAVIELGPQSMFVLGADLAQLDLSTLEARIRALGIAAKVRARQISNAAPVQKNPVGEVPLTRDFQSLKRSYSTTSSFEMDRAYTEITQILGPEPKFLWNPVRGGPLVLRWTPNSAAMYEVTIQSGLNEKRQTSVVQESSLTLRSLDAGPYQWNVRSVNSRGERGPASVWQTFIVQKSDIPAKSAASSILSAPRILPVRIKAIPAANGGAR